MDFRVCRQHNNTRRALSHGVKRGQQTHVGQGEQMQTTSASVFRIMIFFFQDDDVALRFVAACANIRAHIFHIAGKSLFDIKCKF